MSEAELSDFVESLVPKNDPATGFTAPAGSALSELDAVTVESSPARSCPTEARGTR